MKNLNLGKRYNLLSGETKGERLEYNLDNLTTHAVITGMTGSGKTGLGLTLIEELALQSLPVIMIDPKGDLTNSLLHFPQLRDSDFAKWTDNAKQTAQTWRTKLNESGITEDDIKRIDESVEYTIYTPGADAGAQVSVLASLSAPKTSWDEHADRLQQRIAGTVTALMGLVGYENVDPVNSEEHILLCNIIEYLWRDGVSLTLEDLIMYVLDPPFDKLGVFSVSEFCPNRDRQNLAHKINNFLASPSFANWIEGETLDIDRILYNKDGKPRHTVFYIAHLEEKERMFFVTLLYTAIESWMRKTKGSPGLKAAVYFDEITGYLPPISNPPSKGVILRMLKHARAYGVGMILASQNPVDLDYKALSNAGTWFVGKLQTPQDRNRLVSGIEGNIGKDTLNDIISSLDTRLFMMHNINRQLPVVFKSRWVMNYLAGPLTLDRIPDLNKMAGVEIVKQKPQEQVIVSHDCTSTVGYHYRSVSVTPQEALAKAGLPPTKQYPYEIYKARTAKGYKPPNYYEKRHKKFSVPHYTRSLVTDEMKHHGVLWTPYYGFIIDGKFVLLPAFEKGA